MTENTENLILIVDDDPCCRIPLAALLRHRGFTVISVENGLEAIQATLDCRPVLIVMDIDMPGMSGYAAATEILASRGTADVPIVGFSANDDVITRKRAFEAGMIDFVPKPWFEADIDRALKHVSSARSKSRLTVRSTDPTGNGDSCDPTAA
jgi:CheY-like chemotaxis protein